MTIIMVDIVSSSDSDKVYIPSKTRTEKIPSQKAHRLLKNSLLSSFCILLCGSAGGDQHYTQGSTLCRKRFICLLVDIVGSVQ